ncbi:hypothetical protein ACFCX4_28805 [Kitasatospora sp. NPDC056327]|uniref:hypothetical protein n=1 Tax=Kitasatospora sp. NPDC056327 TaxID=3345785 RepID=UPI0035D95C44
MDVLHTVALAGVPLLALRSALRIRHRGWTLTPDHAVACLASGLAVWYGLTGGPGWLLIAGCVTAAVTVAAEATALAPGLVRHPVVTVDPAGFRERLLAACASPSGPERFLAGVGPDGTITVWGLESAGVPRDRHRTGSACATCCLEDIVAELADNGPETVAEYRIRLRGRANQLFRMQRTTIGHRWTADLAPVVGFKTPFEHSPCSEHRL